MFRVTETEGSSRPSCAPAGHARRPHGAGVAAPRQGRPGAASGPSRPAALGDPRTAASAWRTKRLRLAGLFLCVTAVARAPSGLSDTSTRQTTLVWPPAPEVARIQYVRSLAGAEDIEGGRSLLRRLVELVAGSRSPRIRQPYGVAVDAEGLVYVADAAARQIHIFDERRRRYEALRGPGRDGFRRPLGVATDDHGRLYVSDAEKAVVLGFDRGRKAVLTISDSLQRPAGIAFNPRNRLLYVTDVLRHEVRAYDSTGHRALTIGTRGSGPGQFSYPTNLAVDREGRLYVTDALNCRVQIFSADGTFLSGFGRAGDALGDFARPKGIGVDSDGHIFVVEGLYDVVNVFDREGRLFLSFGGAGSRPGEFWLASGLAIDRRDRIYVADSFNGRVQVFQCLGGARPQR